MKATYKVLKFKNTNSRPVNNLEENHSRVLNELGADGYRVVSSTSFEAGQSRYTGFFMVIMEKLEP